MARHSAAANALCKGAGMLLGMFGLLGLGGRASAADGCDPPGRALQLPPGFCSQEFAADLGPVRGLDVAADGDVFVALNSGGVAGLRDRDGDGRAEQQSRFGRSPAHGLQLHAGHLYAARRDEVVRWRREPGQLELRGPPEKIVSGFPQQREHARKGLALGSDGRLFVGVGAPSNSCQRDNRAPRSAGREPCPQLREHAGIWRFDAQTPGQRFSPAQRYATGIRHALALAIHPDTGALWAAMNGRDLLGANWGYSDERNAELPAEEIGPVSPGDDWGWPYCYHDPLAGAKVLAPEYGGDGTAVERCADRSTPAVALPAHWAPMSLRFYTAQQFPPHYRGGLFVALRGSWNRAPLPQQGFRIVFVPFAGAIPQGGFETFATGPGRESGTRFTGVALGPEGSLYVAAEIPGTVWRIRYAGNPH